MRECYKTTPKTGTREDGTTKLNRAARAKPKMTNRLQVKVLERLLRHESSLHIRFELNARQPIRGSVEMAK